MKRIIWDKRTYIAFFHCIVRIHPLIRPNKIFALADIKNAKNYIQTLAHNESNCFMTTY